MLPNIENDGTTGNLSIVLKDSTINRTVALSTELKVPLNKKLVEALNEAELEYTFQTA